MNFSESEHFSVPDPTIRRMPMYIGILDRYTALEREWISTTDFADELGIKPIQVRKDLAYVKVVGRPKKGYLVRELRKALIAFLGWNNQTDAVLVGAGALGSALLGYKGFKEHGLNIVMAFDKGVQKKERSIHGVQVFPMESMENLIRRMKIQIGIITVPEIHAQEVAEQLISAGIKAIWNFSPVKLKVPDSIIVQREDLSSSLAVLRVKLKNLD